MIGLKLQSILLIESYSGIIKSHPIFIVFTHPTTQPPTTPLNRYRVIPFSFQVNSFIVVIIMSSGIKTTENNFYSQFIIIN